MASKKSSKSRKAPWQKSAPRTAKHHSLSPAKKKSAKVRARRAGRPYPNLVDNMQAARAKTGRTSAKKTRKASRKK